MRKISLFLVFVIFAVQLQAQWSHAEWFGPLTNDGVSVNKVATDACGNRILFVDASTNFKIVSTNEEISTGKYLMKVTKDGIVDWKINVNNFKYVDASVGSASINQVKIDADGSIYITLIRKNNDQVTADNPDKLKFTFPSVNKAVEIINDLTAPYTNTFKQHMFLAKYDKNGDFVWGISRPGFNSNKNYDILLDGNDIYWMHKDHTLGVIEKVSKTDGSSLWKQEYEITWKGGLSFANITKTTDGKFWLGIKAYEGTLKDADNNAIMTVTTGAGWIIEMDPADGSLETANAKELNFAKQAPEIFCDGNGGLFAVLWAKDGSNAGSTYTLETGLEVTKVTSQKAAMNVLTHFTINGDATLTGDAISKIEHLTDKQDIKDSDLECHATVVNKKLYLSYYSDGAKSTIGDDATEIPGGVTLAKFEADGTATFLSAPVNKTGMDPNGITSDAADNVIMYGKFNRFGGVLGDFSWGSGGSEPGGYIGQYYDNSLLAGTIEGKDKICKDATEQYTITPEDGFTYAWSTTGATSLTLTSSATLTVTDVNSAALDTFTLSLVASAASCNFAPLTKEIIVMGVPVAPTMIDKVELTCNIVDTFDYSVETDPDYTAYNWTVSGSTAKEIKTNNLLGVVWSAAGDETVKATVTNMCGTSPETTVNVDVNDYTAPDVITGETEFCTGDEAVFSVEELPGIETHKWKFDGPSLGTITETTASATLAVNTAETSKLLAITTNVCGDKDTAELEITVKQTPTADFTVTMNEAEVTLTNKAQGATGWSWTYGDGTGTSTDEAPAAYTYTTEGSYTITLTATNDGCEATAEQNVQIQITQIANVQNVEYAVYPNPATDFINIKTDTNIEYINVVDMLGKTVIRQSINNNQAVLNLSNQIKGVYFLQIQTDKGRITNKIIIK